MRRVVIARAAAAVLAGGWAVSAAGQVTPKNAVQDGNWSDASTWDPAGEPTTTNDANINNKGPGEPTTVTIDQPGEVANFVNVGSVADQAGILIMTGGSLTTADTANSVLVGRVAGSTGTFTMSGGTINVSMGGTGGGFRDFIIGDAGNATATITNGTINVGDVFWIGTAGSSVSSATIGGASVITTNNDFVVGGNATSTGTLTHTGGSISTLDNYVVAVAAGSTGTVTQSGGSVTSAGALIGENGKADYTLTGGTFNITGGTNATRDHDESFKVSQSNATNDDDASIFRQQGGTVNVGTAASPFAPHMFIGDFDNSAGTYQITSGSLIIAGDLNVGAAIASNAAANRVEPNGTNGAQGQALNANGTFVVDGSDGTITVGGGLLANPADKSPARNGAGQQNSSTLRFIFEGTGVSPIDVAGVADLDGALIDIVDPGGYIAANGPVTLIDAAGGFGNFYTITPTEMAGTGEAFTLSPEDAAVFRLSVVPSGAGEMLQVSLIPEPGSVALLGLGASGLLARRRRGRR